MKKNISLIIAVDAKNGLGKNGDLAWRIKSDMLYFKDITTKTHDTTKQNAVIMGRKTWDSIPEKFRPLPGRKNIVLTRNKNQKLELPQFLSLEDSLIYLENDNEIENIFIIGGSQIYNESIKKNIIDTIYLTKINGDFNCDVFFDGIPKNFDLFFQSELYKEGEISYQFLIYKKEKLS